MVDTMADRLRKLMGDPPMSYEKLGAIAGVTAQAVQKWMNGGEVKEAGLRKIADHFRVSPAYLRYGIDAPHPNLNKVRENNAQYSSELSAQAIELARLWMSLSEDRKGYVRDLVQITSYTESRFPFLRRGIPATVSYAKFEVACEEDIQARIRQGDLKFD